MNSCDNDPNIVGADNTDLADKRIVESDGVPSCSAPSLADNTKTSYQLPEEDVLVDIVENDEDDRQPDNIAAIHEDLQDTRHQVGGNFRMLQMDESIPGPSSKMPRMISEESTLHHGQDVFNNEEFDMLNPRVNSYEVFEDEFPDESADLYMGNQDGFVFQDDNYQFYSLDNCTPQGYFVCEMCEDRPAYSTRENYNKHRYRYHGSVVSICACPDTRCELVLSSLGAVKRHLVADHKLPLETHYKKFENIIDFNDWLIFVQYSTDSRYVMHNRQQPRRRQLLFCACSDHRKTNSNINGMLKHKACCPSHINYSIGSDGSIEVIYQMFHYGHNEKLFDTIIARKPWSLPKANRESRNRTDFPQKPLLIGSRPMQYLQIDVVEMLETKYRQGAKYSSVLVVTDLFSKFMFARSLIQGGENDRERIVSRLLMEIFCAFGIPEAYSSVYGKVIVDNCMCQIGHSFRITPLSVSTTTPCYSALKKNVEMRADVELGDSSRWPEALPSTILAHNQTPHALFQYRVSPFEVMFGRRAWYKTHPDSELPWLRPNDEEDDVYRADNFGERTTRDEDSPPIRQHDPDVPIFDTSGKPLEKTHLAQMQRIISVVEARCDHWDELTLVSLDNECADVYRRFGVRYAFIPGDYVYVRVLNIPCEKGGYLKGLIAEACWDGHFPYRVNVQGTRKSGIPSKNAIMPDEDAAENDGEWPSAENQSFWISPYDICASSMEQGVKRQPHFGTNFESLYCTCSPSCSLFKSTNCPFQMSKRCCDVMCLTAPPGTKSCVYHRYYDPINTPVDRFVEHYAQNPEKIVRRVNAQRRNLERMGGGNSHVQELDSRDFRKRRKSKDCMNYEDDEKAVGQTVLDKRRHFDDDGRGHVGNEFHSSTSKKQIKTPLEMEELDDGANEPSCSPVFGNSVDSLTGEEIGAEVLVESSEDVGGASEFDDGTENLIWHRQKLAALQSELFSLESHVEECRPKRNDENPSEDFLVAESRAAVLREKCEKLRKILRDALRHKRLQRMLEESAPAMEEAKKILAARKKPKPPPPPQRKQRVPSPRMDKQTFLVVEENQVFPLVSVIPTTQTLSRSTAGGDVYEPTESDNSTHFVEIPRTRGILGRTKKCSIMGRR